MVGRGNGGHGPTDFGPDGKAGEVPAGVLTELADPVLIPEGVPEERGVCVHDPCHFAEIRGVGQGATSEGIGQVPKQPRAAQAPPSHPVAAPMARASDASQMSPLPSTGMEVTASFNAAMACQSAFPE